jgi:hypothetical protein
LEQMLRFEIWPVIIHYIKVSINRLHRQKTT